MKYTFYKYQGTGNDFIIFDNRQHELDFLTKNQIKSLCDRRFGIGADGLMLLENHPDFDFKMVYYNADGGESSMCGNGGRCLVNFAKSLHIIDTETNFLAVDGAHYAKISENLVSLKMIDVTEINSLTNALSLNSGSPHYIQFVNEIKNFPVFAEGKKIRNAASFIKDGINVNFVEKLSAGLFVRTYERGVENETFSCGTGVTASALIAGIEKLGEQKINIETLGGKLAVSFNNRGDNIFDNIYLMGPGTFVFSGSLDI